MDITLASLNQTIAVAYLARARTETGCCRLSDTLIHTGEILLELSILYM